NKLDIQVQDLKVNNYVLFNGKPYQLDAYDIYKLDSTDGADIKPLLITKDMLISSGMENCTDEILEAEDLHFLQSPEGFYLSDEHKRKLGKPFKYVHQWQNLFYALFQQELNLNL